MSPRISVASAWLHAWEACTWPRALAAHSMALPFETGLELPS